MMDNSMMGLGEAESIDAYIECKYLNFKQKTSVIKGKRNEVVVWNQEFFVIQTIFIRFSCQLQCRLCPVELS